MSALPTLCFPQLAWPAAAPAAAGLPPQSQIDMDFAPIPALVDSDDDETDSATSSPTSSLGSLRDFTAAGMYPLTAKDARTDVQAPILPAPPNSSGRTGHQRTTNRPPRVATFRIDPTPPWSASSVAASPLVECWSWDASGPAPVQPASNFPAAFGPAVALTRPEQLGTSESAFEQTRVLHNPILASPPALPFRTPEAQRSQAAPPSRLSIAMRRAVQRRLSLSFEADSAPAPVHAPGAPLSPPQIVITRPDGMAGPPVGLGLGRDLEDDMGLHLESSMSRSVQGCATELPIPTVTVTPPGQTPTEAYDACTLPVSDAVSARAAHTTSLDRFEGETFDDDTTVDVDLAYEMAAQSPHSEWGQASETDTDFGISSPLTEVGEVEMDDELFPSSTQVCFSPRSRPSNKRLAGRKMVQRLGLRAGLAC